jgi:hypothetical protein
MVGIQLWPAGAALQRRAAEAEWQEARAHPRDHSAQLEMTPGRLAMEVGGVGSRCFGGGVLSASVQAGEEAWCGSARWGRSQGVNLVVGCLVVAGHRALLDSVMAARGWRAPAAMRGREAVC